MQLYWITCNTHQSQETKRETFKRKIWRMPLWGKKKMLTHRGLVTLMGIRGFFSCDDSSHDLCRYRRLLWPWELLMFGLAGDCGNWRSLEGFLFLTSHRLLSMYNTSIIINIHQSSCGFFRDMRHWSWIEFFDIALNPPSLEDSFSSVENIEFISSTLLEKKY